MTPKNDKNHKKMQKNANPIQGPMVCEQKICKKNEKNAPDHQNFKNPTRKR